MYVVVDRHPDYSLREDMVLIGGHMRMSHEALELETETKNSAFAYF